MKLHILVASIAIVLSATVVNAQNFSKKNYPQGYFIWPVVATKALAANFGELRPNHYHMGLDCKTDKKENVNVLAAADGYIAKVKIEPFGFGRAIYINHPNGLTTLYAHLNNFNPELEKYVKEQQYKLKSWRIFIDIPANLFPVKKGMFIAFSGNTGGSQGPHTHFEIRDTKSEKVLNPSLFGFPLPDNVPPNITRLALYDRCISTFEQSPKFISLLKTSKGYTTSPNVIVVNTDRVSFAISATDSYTGSSNPNGIYEAILYEDESPIVGFQIDSISYDETRYVNAHIDYKLKSTGGPYVEHLSKLPGYNNTIYKSFKGDGVISIDDDSIHKIKIVVKDAIGNTSIVNFLIKKGANVKTTKPVIDSAIAFNKKEFRPGYINIFETNNVSVVMPQNCLYDSLRFKFNEIPSSNGFNTYQIHNANIPVQSNYIIKIKANSPFPNKMLMHRFANGKNDYAKTDVENGWYKASFRDFGNFQLMIDTVAPNIVASGFKDGMNCSHLNHIAFVVTDNTENIKTFTALLDGNWLRFTNDKGKTFIYNFDEMCTPGEHELKITAEDTVGNIAEKMYHFTK